MRAHPLDDEFHRERTADFERITVPVLSATNWAHILHTRGNFEGYRRAPREQKWLEVHGLEHWIEFYTDYGVALQKRFFGHFLKGEDTGWEKQPPVYAQRAHGRRRASSNAPSSDGRMARTQWTKLHLDIPETRHSRAEPDESGREVVVRGAGRRADLLDRAADRGREMTGPPRRSSVASSTADADLFLTLRVLDPDGQDVFSWRPGPARHRWHRAGCGRRIAQPTRSAASHTGRGTRTTNTSR